MKIKLIACSILMIVPGISADLKTVLDGITPVNYTGYSLFQVTPRDQTQASFLRSLQEKGLLDFWTGSNYGPIEVLVPPGLIKSVFQFLLQLLGIPFTIILGNIGPFASSFQCADLNQMDFKYYHIYQNIADWMHQIEARCSTSTSTKVKVIDIGKTVQGNSIYAIKITFDQKNRYMLIDAGIHAREWIAPASVAYLINTLTEHCQSSDPTTQNKKLKTFMLFNYVIVPVLNVDGYMFSCKWARFWKKNLSNNFPRTPYPCPGTDLNRNFGINWNNASGSSPYPCADDYSGSAGNSEPETKALINLIETEIKSLGDFKFVIYLTYHSYGQYILYPYGDGTEPDDLTIGTLVQLAKAMGKSMSAVNGNNYTVGNMRTLTYPVNGCSADYVISYLGIFYSLTIVLPPKSSVRYPGYLLGAEEIPSVGEEVNEGIFGLIKAYFFELP